MIDRYKALALQLACHTVNRCLDREESMKLIRDNVQYVKNSIRASKAFIGNALKLIVLPEYILTGFPMGESMDSWKEKAAIHLNDPTIGELRSFCVQNGIYLGLNFYEIEDHFPQFYFQTCVIINDEGVICLVYRRLNSMYTITPHDILTQYVQVYGEESIFPVANTPIGNLACIASEEILYPEIGRSFMVRGAEIFIHSSSEVGSPIPTQKDIAKQARSIENMAYVISANTGKLTGTAFPDGSADGGSRIIDPEGRIISLAGSGDSMVANAWIDLAHLRYLRAQPGMANYISRQRFELYRSTYERTFYPKDNALDFSSGRLHFNEIQRSTIEALKKRKVIHE
ncbi:MAG TPA: nitrilase-related carbon-nitrogen hydrolase [Saprospiraceae bacterium]|nr:nitrilase-related carbon-nitrogen hydrolase [Saprospiraceae bacterium]